MSALDNPVCGRAGRRIAALPPDACGLRETARVVRYRAAGFAGRGACGGSGLCAEMLPNSITLDDWGSPSLAKVPCRHLLAGPG